MVPAVGDAPFDDPDWFFEPWWPGASALAYVENFKFRLQIEHLADPLAAFPELGAVGEQFAADQSVVAGALLVLDDEGRPDAELLRRRLADPASRDGTAAFVASDLLFELGQSIAALPFEERRQLLTTALADGERCVVSRGVRGEGTTLAEALASMGIAEISARLLASPYKPGAQDATWLRLPVVEVPTAPTRPLLTVLSRLPI